MNALTEAGQRLDFLDQELFAICPGVAILLTTTRVTTWRGTCPLSSAGGFFFRTADPDALSRWYADHLGIGPGLGTDPGGDAPYWRESARLSRGSRFMVIPSSG